MAITFHCNGCGKKFVIANEKLAGRTGSCSACGAALVIPDTQSYELEPVPESEEVFEKATFDIPQPITRTREPLPPPVDLMDEGSTANSGRSVALIGIVSITSAVLVGGLVMFLMSRSKPAKVDAVVAQSPPNIEPASVPKFTPKPTIETEYSKAEALFPTVGEEPSTKQEPTNSNPSTAKPTGSASVPAAPLTTVQIIAKADPSVGVVRGPTSSGTGFLVGPGLLATNAHVIRRTPASQLKVHFPSAPANQRGPFPIKVVYFDDERDLAVLSLNTKLEPLTVRGDHQFTRGQEVIFIGSPGLGGAMILENVASKGILGSRVKLDDLDYYQLSGSVNGGNSGGPIIDMEGQVIGVVTARASKEEGLGFCVPAADLAKAVETASTGDRALQADAAQRHEASAKLATMRVARPTPTTRGQPAPKTQNDPTAEFLRNTEPATWLASVDSNLVLKDSSPRVTPFRAKLKKADTIYLEDDRTIAVMMIQAVMKVRDSGLPVSCAMLLESSLNWAPDSYLRGSTARSFQDFAEHYCEFRINERLDHKTTILRLQSVLAKPSTAAQEKPADKPSSSSSASKSATKKSNPDSPSSRFETARGFEDDGNTQAAIFAYEALIDKYPQSSQAEEAKARLKKLKGQ